MAKKPETATVRVLRKVFIGECTFEPNTALTADAGICKGLVEDGAASDAEAEVAWAKENGVEAAYPPAEPKAEEETEGEADK